VVKTKTEALSQLRRQHSCFLPAKSRVQTNNTEII